MKFLTYLNFGDKFSNMFKFLQTSPFYRIEEKSFLSKKIPLLRGCRQGDPISPNIVVVCAEVLSHLMSKLTNILLSLLSPSDDLICELNKDLSFYVVFIFFFHLDKRMRVLRVKLIYTCFEYFLLFVIIFFNLVLWYISL